MGQSLLTVPKHPAMAAGLASDVEVDFRPEAVEEIELSSVTIAPSDGDAPIVRSRSLTLENAEGPPIRKRNEVVGFVSILFLFLCGHHLYRHVAIILPYTYSGSYL